MTRNSLHTAIAVALVGCKKKDETAAIPPPAAEPAPAPAPMPTEPAPAPATTSVTMVDLGNTVGTDNRVTVPATTFAKGDTIHASVASDGAAGNLTAKWTFGDQVVDTQDKAVAAGPQVTEFSVSKPDGWPLGKYKLEVSTNGTVVQTRDFEVK